MGGEDFVSQAEKASSRRRRRLRLAGGEDYVSQAEKTSRFLLRKTLVLGLLRDFDNLPPKTLHGTDHPSSSHGLIGVTNVMVGNLGTEVTTESLSADAMVRSSGIDDLMETSGTRVATRSSGVVNVEGLRVPTSWWDRQASDDDDVEADDDEDGDEEIDEEIDD
ncbi:hypothetical protein AALP_AAs69573U000100 [Arabis alpina]|uniref:Uncharacterized protein n=1 Tax=Arabis alpina TaxID=50452 RepID=A0A087G1B8_ARAAL|nr:hypothetical protein AALP_AAs69573U000100 [Arabis alpina]